MSDENSNNDQFGGSSSVDGRHAGSAVSAKNGRARQLRTLLHHDDHEHTAPLPAQPAGRVSRTLVNFWLDTLLAAVFVVLCITAVIVQFVFPPGVAARGAILLSMTYGQWCGLQFSLLAVFGLGVLIHVMLHWTWICSVVTKRILGRPDLPDDGIRTIYGVALLIGLLLTGAICVGFAQWLIVLPE